MPVPSITVGHEKSLMSISPLALRFWDVLGIEPFSQPRDIAYIVVAPDNPLLLEHTKKFFRNLSVSYEVRTYCLNHLDLTEPVYLSLFAINET